MFYSSDWFSGDPPTHPSVCPVPSVRPSQGGFAALLPRAPTPGQKNLLTIHQIDNKKSASKLRSGSKLKGLISLTLGGAVADPDKVREGGGHCLFRI